VFSPLEWQLLSQQRQSNETRPGLEAIVPCEKLSTLLAQTAGGLTHIDFLSLDVEGYELLALRTVDWATTTIDTMTVETKGDNRQALATSRQIWELLRDSARMVPVLCLGVDTLFVRREHRAAVLAWYAAASAQHKVADVRERNSTHPQGERLSRELEAVLPKFVRRAVPGLACGAKHTFVPKHKVARTG